MGAFLAVFLPSGVVAVALVFLTLLCLKIKSSRKDPALASVTEGTIKFNVNVNNDVNNVNNEVNINNLRTPSRTGDRRLPEIPRPQLNDVLKDEDEDESDLDEDEADSAVGKRQAASSINPYATVNKAPAEEHPYATVKKDNGANRRSLDVNVQNAPSSRQSTPLPPEPPQNQMQNPQQHFSGDSQDSSKGYTSITVREPARHIQLNRNHVNVVNGGYYATVSETSDEMYAAIMSQSNSDTYAVIDLPNDDVEADPDPQGASANYSRVDKSKKKLPLLPPPRRNDVEEMYAKVNKRPNAVDPDLDLPVGASAMQVNLGGARPKVVMAKKSEINYSDYEVALYDKEDKRRRLNNDPGYETVPGSDSNGGYETVPDSTSNKDGYERVRGPEDGAVDKRDHGYERLPGDVDVDYWRSTNSGGGYETVRGGDDEDDVNDHAYDSIDRRRLKSSRSNGYESVVKRPNEPPYAEVVKKEGEYETIKGGGGSEPGYETVSAPPPVPSLPLPLPAGVRQPQRAFPGPHRVSDDEDEVQTHIFV